MADPDADDGADRVAADSDDAAEVGEAAGPGGDATAEDETDAAPEAEPDTAAGGAADGRREVEVPMALYKRVTVFGTLIAVVSVLLGFVLLDAATLRGSRLREWTVVGLEAVGLSVPSGVLSGLFALLGLGAIALGAGVYVLSTRFRTEGMGKSKDRADEESDNG